MIGKLLVWGLLVWFLYKFQEFLLLYLYITFRWMFP